KILVDYQLLKKVQGITVDNVSANTTFMHELSYLMPDGDGILNPIDNHFKCFGHILNLGAQDLMKIIKSSEDAEESDIEYSDDENVDGNDYSLRQDTGTSVIAKLRNLFTKLKFSEKLTLKK
ncbi:hypothetical protein, partial [Enterobacter cloacae complex sp. 2DZ2F20B]|uniref:hypothetical protein n=1 Tax=Enterobacter cloacae complex sp. 2DZ2F20B TaxID=2511993 RepID=UPI001026AF1A